MSNERRTNLDYTLTEREDVTLCRIAILAGKDDHWLADYAAVLNGRTEAAPGKRFLNYLRLVARAASEHPEAAEICYAEGHGIIRRWLRYERDVPANTQQRLVPELQEAALRIAQKLLDRRGRIPQSICPS